MNQPIRLGPLHWAQHWLWLNAAPSTARGAPPEVLWTAPAVPPGLPATAVPPALAELVQRHETLRTLYQTEPNGTPVQCVHSHIPPAVAFVELDAASRPDDWELAARLPAAPDLSRGPILRAVVGVTGDEVRYLVVAAPVLAIDLIALIVLRDELTELLRAAAAGDSPRLDPPSGQPLDQALAQAEPAPRRAAEAALRYWEAVLADAPHASLPFYHNGIGRSDSGSLETSLTSIDLATHATAAARSYRNTPTSVLLAALGVLLTAWTGHDRCRLEMAVGNRRHERSRPPSVGRYAGLAPLVLGIGDNDSLPELLTQTFTAQAMAQRYAGYDVGALVMAEARQSLRRGTRSAMAIHLDVRADPRTIGSMRSPEAGVQQGPDPTNTASLNLVIRVLPDRVSLRLRAPMSLLDSEAAEAFLRQLESLVRVAAEEDSPPLSAMSALVDLPSSWRGRNWVSIQRAWVNLDDCARLLRTHPDVKEAAVFASDSAPSYSEPTLTAYAAGQDLTVSQLYEYMRDVVSHHPTAVVPHQYVICQSGPADPADEPQWRAGPVLARGEGTVTEPDTPLGPREEALASAFATYHPEQSVRMSATYAELGGDFLRIPAVLDELERRGFAGIRFGHLIGMASLRQLASRLAGPAAANEGD